MAETFGTFACQKPFSVELEDLIANGNGKTIMLLLSFYYCRRTKLFGGQSFRHKAKFSAILSAEVLSVEVLEVLTCVVELDVYDRINFESASTLLCLCFVKLVRQ